ncbi:MAG: hypothetical protein A4E65_03656 [Syntrophorhabdus sp. PtaU1.Bin153]|nr:MAG: hypothetical protein A4E65_03656 [Syntrophorhabdus sp. PtaU1.Bin153]
MRLFLFYAIFNKKTGRCLVEIRYPERAVKQIERIFRGNKKDAEMIIEYEVKRRQEAYNG